MLLTDMLCGVLRDWIDSAVKPVRFVGHLQSFQSRTSKSVSYAVGCLERQSYYLSLHTRGVSKAYLTHGSHFLMYLPIWVTDAVCVMNPTPYMGQILGQKVFSLQFSVERHY